MSQTDLLDSVGTAIEARCGVDASQRSAIFSPSKRVFVEAPRRLREDHGDDWAGLLAAGIRRSPAAKKDFGPDLQCRRCAENASGFGRHYVGASGFRDQAF